MKKQIRKEISMFPYLMFLAGIVVGVIIMKLRTPKNIGTLGFYNSEPGEPPAMVAELNRNVEDIGKLRIVTMTVSHR